MLIESVAPTERVGVQGTADLTMSLCGAVAGFASGFIRRAVGYHVLADVAAAAALGLLLVAYVSSAPVRTTRPQRRPRAGCYRRRVGLKGGTAVPKDKPNILVIWGDDIGITNLSCYSDGLMGYRTPNIDRIANEGMRFTDAYGEQSCTAGRSSFITGQSVFRTGLSKVGLPGSPIGLQAEDPTIAELLKNHGYATGQFGKNHLGDQQRVPADGARLRRVLRQPLPPQRRGGSGGSRLSERDYGFHGFKERFGPRGVLRCYAARERTTRPSIHAGDGSASRRSRTPAR